MDMNRYYGDVEQLELVVMKSGAGYYIGTCEDGSPYSRESAEYYRSSADAQLALDSNSFTQRNHY